MNRNFSRPDDTLLRYFDERLSERGDTAQGAYWPNEPDRRTRFDVMLDVVPRDAGPVVLCDLGCGTGELLGHIKKLRRRDIDYVGVDRSAAALTFARAKFPDERFVQIDVNAPGEQLDDLACDYLVANGLFTVKFDLSHEEMWSFLVTTIERVWPLVRKGLAFNVMSKVVDWERDDLFHLPLDDAARLLHRLAGRRIRFRADYGLYEYTAYAYKPASEAGSSDSDPAATPTTVPVLRPRLPTAQTLDFYLRRIDANRIYTNHGPLLLDLEQCLAISFSASQDYAVACAGSGTVALMGAILAAAGPATARKPFALMPAFTFVATAAAAERCGYQVLLADIDPETWMLDPAMTQTHPRLDSVGVVIPVAPFGRPVPQQPWLEFQERSGVPVVIDDAASTDRLMAASAGFLGPLPVVLSFHATKAFATGEGGGVVSSDQDIIRRVVRALNFGFETMRDSIAPSVNGKMSEYHAAVGLAELEGWPAKRASLERVIFRYSELLRERDVANRLVMAPDISLTYCLFRCGDGAEASRIRESFERAGIGWRLWYGTGLQRQTLYRNLSRERFPEIDAVAPRLLGLPMAPDLTDAHLAHITSTLAAAVANQ
jgi:dTDP-4-amino-4,6-dideoxygalactose transaminase/SAM-dependent methyltransferase